MRQQRNIFQTKEKDKTPEELSEVETGHLPKQELRVIKTIKEFRRMDAQSKKLYFLNKENIKNNQTEMKNTITDMESTRKNKQTK